MQNEIDEKVDNVEEKNENIIKTDTGAKDGQNKCPKCGATDISLNVNTGMLRCEFCRHEFKAETISGMEEDISKLEGQTVASGTQDIDKEFNDVVTLKCTSCGAEVVIDTKESTQSRCHWCRNTLSINNQIPNGAVPDAVLPFKITKDDAKNQIETFVGKRKMYAHPKFKEEFTTNNVMGVYFPYMVVDINSHAAFSGKGEHQTRCYTEGNKEHRHTYYDADLYDIDRSFDIAINGLTVESSSDKLDKTNSNNTNNIINSIMPFDIENCVKWDSNYLKGYSSEKRDTNVDELKPLVEEQSLDIARFACNDTLKHYDRGVKWESQNLDIKGQQWKSAYFPVWLYSYQQEKGSEKLLHYVAVNARTKETMGSVPIHMPKLFLVSLVIEVIAGFASLFIDSDYSFLALFTGFIYFAYIYFTYRNSNARHFHEKETKKEVSNMQKMDNKIRSLRRLSNPTMNGANNNTIGKKSMFK